MSTRTRPTRRPRRRDRRRLPAFARGVGRGRRGRAGGGSGHSRTAAGRDGAGKERRDAGGDRRRRGADRKTALHRHHRGLRHRLRPLDRRRRRQAAAGDHGLRCRVPRFRRRRRPGSAVGQFGRVAVGPGARKPSDHGALRQRRRTAVSPMSPRRSGLDRPIYGMGVAVGDIDDDGDPDLFITAVGSNRLLRNDGGRFVDVTEAAGVAGATTPGAPVPASSTPMATATSTSSSATTWGGRERPISRSASPSTASTAPTGRRRRLPAPRPPSTATTATGVSPRSRQRPGLHVVNPATGEPMAKSLGLALADLDGDGRLDILLANDTVRNFLFLNRGDWTLRGGRRRARASPTTPPATPPARWVSTSPTSATTVTWRFAVGNFANEMASFYRRPGRARCTSPTRR